MDAIKNNISRITTQDIKVRRFFSTLNLKPLPIMSITCEKDTAHKLLEEGLPLFGKNFACETFKKPIIRCYNCHKFGHISKHCGGVYYCHHCVKNHQAMSLCKKSSSNQKLQHTSLQQL